MVVCLIYEIEFRHTYIKHFIIYDITRHKIMYNIKDHIRYFTHMDFSSSSTLVEANFTEVLTDLFKNLYLPLFCMVAAQHTYRDWLKVVSKKLLQNTTTKIKQSVLVITCLGGRFRINCPSAFLKILKLPKWNEANFRIFKNHKGDLSPESPEPNMWG